MEATLEPILEAVAIPGRISGAEVICDLLDRIGERLSRSCDLRPSDSYAAYSAKVTVELSLVDVDTVEVVQQIAVGTPDSQQPTQPITLEVPLVEPVDVEERLGLPQTESLERCVDGSLPEAAGVTAKAEKRYYTPRNAVPLSSRGSK
jgi:hypothetical protein